MAKGGYRGLKGNGAGWGGPAKGPGKSGPGSGAGRPKASEAALKAASKAERLALLTDNLTALAFDAENEMVKLNATVRAIEFINGKAVSRSAKVEHDDITKLSDAELAQRRAELERARIAAEGGGAPAAGSSEPPDLVH